MIRLEIDQLEVWCEGLGDLTLPELRYALRRFNQECTDFPTIAAVRRFAGPKGLSDEQRAARVWDVVTSAIRDQGAYRSADFDDRIVNAVIRSYGGWERLCDSKLDDWVRRRFIESYVSVAKAGGGNASPLPGIAERENGGRKRPPVGIACGLPVHAIQKRLEYAAPDSLKRLAAPAVRQVGEKLGAWRKQAKDDKRAAQEQSRRDEEQRIAESAAAKQKQIDQARAMVAMERQAFIDRVTAKRARKKARKAVAQ